MRVSLSVLIPVSIFEGFIRFAPFVAFRLMAERRQSQGRRNEKRERWFPRQAAGARDSIQAILQKNITYLRCSSSRTPLKTALLNSLSNHVSVASFVVFVVLGSSLQMYVYG